MLAKLGASLLILSLLGTTLWSWSEVRRVRGHAAREASLREQDHALALSELEQQAADRHERQDAELRRLERELATAVTQRELMTSRLAEARDQMEAQRADFEERRRSRNRPMPPGLRDSLARLNQTLREEGYPGLRFLWAEAIRDRMVCGAEILESGPDGLRVVMHQAERVALELDREASTLTLQLFDGFSAADGGATELPGEGRSILLQEVYGPLWEARFPYLVEARGSYPATPEQEQAERMDPVSASDWLRRVEQLLESSALGPGSHRLASFDSLRDGRFTNVLFLSYDQGKKLEQSAEAASLECQVNRRTGTVSLVLRDGILRKRGGETTIPPSGYSIFLPGVGVDEAVDLMMGMVQNR